jgi:hypothetical protein
MNESQIAAHYAHDHLYETILQALASEGKTPGANKLFTRIDQKGIPALGLHLLMGDTAQQKLNNLRSNLIDERVALESGIYEKA